MVGKLRLDENELYHAPFVLFYSMAIKKNSNNQAVNVGRQYRTVKKKEL